MVLEPLRSRLGNEAVANVVQYMAVAELEMACESFVLSLAEESVAISEAHAHLQGFGPPQDVGFQGGLLGIRRRVGAAACLTSCVSGRPAAVVRERPVWGRSPEALGTGYDDVLCVAFRRRPKRIDLPGIDPAAEQEGFEANPNQLWGRTTC